MRHIFLLVALLVLSACTGYKSGSNLEEAKPSGKEIPAVQEIVGAETYVEMVNVNIHLDTSLILRIQHLTGKFLPTKRGRPPTFDDKLSYIIAIDSAEVAISMTSMTHFMNTYVFGESNTPLKNLKLSSHGS